MQVLEFFVLVGCRFPLDIFVHFLRVKFRVGKYTVVLLGF